MELFNLSADPSEENNIAEQHQEIVNRLKQKATDIVVNGRTTEGAVQMNDTGYWDHLTWISEEGYDLKQANL